MSLLLKNYKIKRDDNTILDDVSLCLQPGEVHVLMGPNGAGKSTLAKGLSGHPDYDQSGEYTINDVDAITLAPEDRAKQGLYVSYQETIAIPGLTYIQFLKAAKEAITGQKTLPIPFYKQLVDLAKQHNIDHTLLQKSVGDDLSGGERKKLELLQIMLLKPKYLILDEIDAGLDVTSLQSIIKDIVTYVKAGNSVLFVTHHPDIALQLNPDVVHILNNKTITSYKDQSIIETVRTNGYE